MLFDLLMVAAGVGAFVISGFKNSVNNVSSSSSSQSKTRKKPSQWVNVYENEYYAQYLSEIKERYKNPIIEEIVDQSSEWEYDKLAARIYRYQTMIYRCEKGYIDKKLMVDCCKLSLHYKSDKMEFSYNKKLIEASRKTDMDCLLETYGLLHPMYFRGVEDGGYPKYPSDWMDDLIEAVKTGYKFPILEEIDPSYIPTTLTELKINAELKKIDPERFKNLRSIDIQTINDKYGL